jgi:transitional endoplasmic reticulum ATPase
MLYCFKWPSGFGQTTEQFILHEGPASVSRELLLAIGIWADQLHNEIWVYNQGWSKNSGLWQEIWKARWEDVILESAFKTAIQKDVLGFFSSKDTYKSLTLPWKVTSYFRGPLHHTYPIALF